MKYWTWMIRRTLAKRQETSVDKRQTDRQPDPAGGTFGNAKEVPPGGGMSVRRKIVKVCLPKE